MKEAYHTYDGVEYINGQWEDTILEVGQQYPCKDFKQYTGPITEDTLSKLYIIPDLLSGSDYSGGTVNKSNYRSFMKLYKDTEGVYGLFGGYNTYSIAIRADVAESNEDIKSTLDTLEDYPIIDDDNYNTLETEIECESLKVYISDNKNVICRHLEEYIENIDDIIDAIPDEDLEQIAYDGINNLNLNWIHEPQSAYLTHVEELVSYIEDRLLIDHCKELPLLINREWTCSDTNQKYKDRFNQEAL